MILCGCISIYWHSHDMHAFIISNISRAWKSKIWTISNDTAILILHLLGLTFGKSPFRKIFSVHHNVPARKRTSKAVSSLKGFRILGKLSRNSLICLSRSDSTVSFFLDEKKPFISHLLQTDSNYRMKGLGYEITPSFGDYYYFGVLTKTSLQHS